jgi:crotonobetainyl-CoA:carnitine CoA-transferase CaiB-like acyl-CoA transferase
VGRVLNPPLTGLRVVEVGNYMAGPFCGMHLADLGADVVKVEHPPTATSPGSSRRSRMARAGAISA